MIKIASKLPDGRILIVIGLSDGNVERLKKDDPIVFNMRSLGFDPQWVAIAWKHEDGMAGFPRNFSGIGLAYSTAALDAMQQWPNVLDNGNYRFTVFRGTDEQTMERDCRGLIGTGTVLQHQGYAPSEIPPSDN